MRAAKKFVVLGRQDKGVPAYHLDLIWGISLAMSGPPVVFITFHREFYSESISSTLVMHIHSIYSAHARPRPADPVGFET